MSVTAARPGRRDLLEKRLRVLAQRLAIDWRGRRVLAVDCPAEVAHALARRGAGVSRAADGSRFDVAVAAGPALRAPAASLEQTLDELFARLVPGGYCLLATETFFAPYADGLQDRLSTPFAHLLFPRRILDAYLADRGEPPQPPTNTFGATSYLAACARAGFDVVAAEHIRTPKREVPRSIFPKLDAYDAGELETAALAVALSKPTRARRRLPALSPEGAVLDLGRGAPLPAIEQRSLDRVRCRVDWRRLDPDAAEEVFGTAYELLRPGGTMTLVADARPGRRTATAGPLTPSAVLALLVRVGFEPIDVQRPAQEAAGAPLEATLTRPFEPEEMDEDLGPLEFTWQPSR